MCDVKSHVRSHMKSHIKCHAMKVNMSGKVEMMVDVITATAASHAKNDHDSLYNSLTCDVLDATMTANDESICFVDLFAQDCLSLSCTECCPVYLAKCC